MCYMVRWMGISAQLRSNLDPKYTMIQAGHSDLRTTMKYDRILDEDRERFINNFEGIVIHKNEDSRVKAGLVRRNTFFG